MKLLDRYEFTNGRVFETYYLNANDTYLNDVPECDVIGFLRVSDKPLPMMVMRPDEALIQARMLVDAVRKVTERYEIGDIDSRDNPSSAPLATELVEALRGSQFMEINGHDLSPAIKAISAEFLPEQGWIKMILASDSPLITEVLFPLINGIDDYCDFAYRLPSGQTISGKACIQSSGFNSHGNFYFSLIVSGDVLRS